jgi:1,4-alpha-glucan branching enzyme
MVTQTPDGKVQFSFYRPYAQSVNVVGDFNGWHESSLPMVRDRRGWWRYELRLSPGYYQFRYRCDGQWFTDYAAFGVEHSPYGLNSVLKVEVPAGLEQETLAESFVLADGEQSWTDAESAQAISIQDQPRTPVRQPAMA